MVGMTVTDSWHACRHHLPAGHAHKLIAIADFTSILAKDCLDNQHSLQRPSEMILTIGKSPTGREPAVLSLMPEDFETPAKGKHPRLNPSVLTNLSASTMNSTIKATEWLNHRLQKTPPTARFFNQRENRHGLRSEHGACRFCKNKTPFFCPICEESNACRHWVCMRNECTDSHKRAVRELKSQLCKRTPGSLQWFLIKR